MIIALLLISVLCGTAAAIMAMHAGLGLAIMLVSYMLGGMTGGGCLLLWLAAHRFQPFSLRRA